MHELPPFGPLAHDGLSCVLWCYQVEVLTACSCTTRMMQA